MLIIIRVKLNKTMLFVKVDLDKIQTNQSGAFVCLGMNDSHELSLCHSSFSVRWSTRR